MSNIQYFSAASSANFGVSSIWNMFRGFYEGRYLGWRLFVKGVRNEVRQTYFGFVWHMVEPIILAIVFVFLQEEKILKLSSNSEISYGLFVMFGLLLFQAFFDTLMSPINVFAESSSLIKQIRIQPEALIIQKILRASYNSIFKILILGGVCLWSGGVSVFGFLLFVGVLGIMQVFCLSFGFLLAPLNTIYRDIGNLVSNTSRPFLFVSPIFYTPGEGSLLEAINLFNPLAIFITTIREVATTQHLESPTSFIVMVVISLVLFLISALFFRLSIPVLTDKVT